MTEEVIIDLKLEQDEGAFGKLAQLKGGIVNLKQEARDLQTAYKSGQITLKEFSSESVRVEALLKKQTATYNNVQRSVTGLKSPFDKLNQSIKDQANQVQVAGISLAKFANPVTATIAVLGGLFTAYARTTVGAKDLEFAQNQLAAATGIVGNQLALLISGGQDGEGFFSKLTSTILNQLSPALAAASRGQAMLQEQMQDLEREEIRIRGDMAARLEENQEKLTQIGLAQTSYNDKIRLSDEIVQNLKDNQQAIGESLGKQLQIAEDILAADPFNEKKEENRNQAQKDLNRELARAERLIQGAQRAQDNIRDSVEKTTAALQKQNDDKDRDQEIEEAQKEFDAANLRTEEDWKKFDELEALKLGNKTARDQEARDKELEATALHNEEMGLLSLAAFNREKALAELRKGLAAQYTDILLKTANVIALIFGKNKELALLSVLIQQKESVSKVILATIEANAKAVAASPLTFGQPWVAINTFSAGLSIATAIASVAAQMQGFAGGGLTGTRINAGMGRRINRSNGDNMLATVKTGEVILNESQQAALGGSRTFKRLGVPGFAMGGQIGRLPQDFDSRSLVRAFKTQQIAVIIEQVEAKMQQRAEIRERATL